MQPKRGSPLKLNFRVLPDSVYPQGKNRHWAQTAQVLNLVLLLASCVTLNVLLRLPDPHSNSSPHPRPCAGSDSGPSNGRAFGKLQRAEDGSGILDLVPWLSRSSTIGRAGVEPIPALFVRGAEASLPVLP